jgi:hypothetical protein
MALNFPNSPTNGQIYTDGSSGNRWVWDSANTAWISTSTFTQTITVSSTQPGSPVVGQLWWNQDYGRLLVYYNDGTSSQWVDASPSDYTSQLAYNQANLVFVVANAAYANANTKLANTTGTLAGALTTTGSISANGYVYITPSGGEEGGEIQLNATGSNTAWSIDSYQNNFRVFARSGATVSNVNFFHATGGSVYMGIGTTSPQTNLHVYGSSKSGFKMTGGSTDSDIFQRHLCQIDNIYTWTTLLSITPSTVGATWMRGFVKCSISCHNSGNGNGALIDAIWYLDLNGGASATTAQVSAGTSSGSYPGQFRVNMSGNIWQLQVQSTNTANRFDGVAMFDILLSHGAGTTATYAIA